MTELMQIQSDNYMIFEFPILTKFRKAKDELKLKRTYELYNRYIEKYNTFLKDKNCLNNMQSVILFFNEFRKDRKTATQQLCKSALRVAFLKIPQVKRDLMAVTLIKEIFKEKLKTSEINHKVSKDELFSIEELIHIFKNVSKRDSLLMRFLYCTGCRISEALGALKKNVEKNGGVKILITGTKNKRDHYLKCDSPLFSEIEQDFKGNKYIFESKSGKQLHSCNVYKSFMNYSTQSVKLFPNKGKVSKDTNKIIDLLSEFNDSSELLKEIRQWEPMSFFNSDNVVNRVYSLFEGKKISKEHFESIIELILKEVEHSKLICTKKLTNKKLNPHSFRHSLATHLSQSGKSFRAIGELLNHKDPSITIRMYDHSELTGEELDDFFNTSGVLKTDCKKQEILDKISIPMELRKNK